MADPRALLLTARRRVLERVARTDRRIDRLYRQAAKTVRQRLMRGQRRTEAQIASMVREEMDRISDEILPEVESNIRVAAEQGDETAQRTVRLLDGPQAPTLPSRATQRAADQIRGRLSVDGLSLSARLNRHHVATSAQVARTITASLRGGETIQRTAERILDAGDPVARLPEHVDRLTSAARAAASGDPVAMRDYRQQVDRWRSRIERLGQGATRSPGAFTIRSATQAFVKDIDGATKARVDRAVDRWVLERARHQARLVARHETAEAYRRSYEETAAQAPGVVGFRWTLSSGHPHKDVCDILANQDLHGLGPGGYPVDSVPETPHPACLCTRAAITDRNHFQRELAQLSGEPEPPREWESGTRETGDEWLRRQPRETQNEILGPTRAAIFRDPNDRRQVLTPQGIPIPVRQVLGLPEQGRRIGPAVSATRQIRADRATLVEPFPTLPERTLTPAAPAAPSAPVPTERATVRQHVAWVDQALPGALGIPRRSFTMRTQRGGRVVITLPAAVTTADVERVRAFVAQNPWGTHNPSDAVFDVRVAEQ